MGTRRDPSTAARLLRPIAWGVGIGAVACTVLLLIASAILTTGAIPQTAVSPIAFAILTVSAFVGGLIAARLSRERGLLTGALVGLLLFLLTAVLGLLILQALDGTSMLLKVALMIGGGALGGVLGVNVKRR